MTNDEQPWFAQAFGEHYLQVYSHRSQKEAEQHLAILFNLARLSELSSAAKVLDLGCGAGRYLSELIKENLWAVGLDYSSHLLKEAQKDYPSLKLKLLRGNMLALPFVCNSFERVLSLFTSFGYFESDDENEWVLAEMARVLKSGGLLYLDYLNPQSVRLSDWEDELRPHIVLRARRFIDKAQNRIVKDIQLFDRDKKNLLQEYSEKVKLYDTSWFEQVGARHSLRLIQLFGNYEGQSLHSQSPRAIYLFEKI